MSINIKDISEWAFQLSKGNLEKESFRVFSKKPWATVLQGLDRDGNLIYLKIPCPAFGKEAAVQRMLADQGYQVLAPLNFTKEDSIPFFSYDAGIPLRETKQDKEDMFPGVVEELPHIQLWATRYSKQVEKLGLSDWRTSNLRGSFYNLVEDIQSNKEVWGVNDDDISSIKHSEKMLDELCKRLNDTNIPQSLCHGDFNDGNVFIKDGIFKIADWGESVIGNPFMAPINYIENRRRRWGNSYDKTEKLAVEKYLGIWKSSGIMQEVDRAWYLSKKIYPIFWCFTFNRLLNGCELGGKDYHNAGKPALKAWINQT